MKNNIIHLEQIDSTNAELKRRAAQGAADGTVVWADEQTAGRGRLNRSWLSEKSKGALFSLLLRGRSEGLVFRCALAAAQVLRDLTGADILVKWPNDIVLHGKKLAGILCEAAIMGDDEVWMIAGIGVNLLETHFPEDLPWAGSVLSETGLKLDAYEFIVKWLTAFNEIQSMSIGEVLNSLIPISATIGNRVRAGEIEGMAEGFDADGSLIIRAEDGVHKIIVGDVSVRGIMGGYT